MKTRIHAAPAVKGLNIYIYWGLQHNHSTLTSSWLWCQGWGKDIESVLGYKYIKNVQVQVQVQGFEKCTWVLPE